MKRTVPEQKPYVPLPARLRPRTLAAFLGQEKAVGPGTSLRQAIETGAVGSLILWGPPGVGKTTLAEIIARQLQAAVERVSAVSAGVKELRTVISQATEWRKIGRRTVLIVDEIHRFNKAQQDVLLPAVEEGIVTLIGATTENPYFAVVSALVSRVEVVGLELLDEAAVAAIIRAALRGELAGFPRRPRLSAAAIKAAAHLAAGDDGCQS